MKAKAKRGRDKVADENVLPGVAQPGPAKAGWKTREGALSAAGAAGPVRGGALKMVGEVLEPLPPPHLKPLLLLFNPPLITGATGMTVTSWRLSFLSKIGRW